MNPNFAQWNGAAGSFGLGPAVQPAASYNTSVSPGIAMG